MIQLHVNAVFAMRDGFTGRVLNEKEVQCTLDGQPYRPVYKTGGYLVFLNLKEGRHTAVFRGAYYREETVRFDAVPDGHAEFVVSLKPNDSYPFGRSATKVELRLTSRGKPYAGDVWIAPADAFAEMKIAQDQTEIGDSQCKIFYRYPVDSLALPRDVMFVDGARSEICTLQEIYEGTGRFGDMFRYSHKRGCAVCPAVLFSSGGDGVVRAMFREPFRLEVLSPSGEEKTFELQAGENTAEMEV